MTNARRSMKLYAFRGILALILAANGVGLFTLLATDEVTRELYPGLQTWMPPALAFLSLLSVVAALALWVWKQWGFVLLCVSYGCMLAINISFTAPLAHTSLGPLGLLLVAATAWPNRHRFRPDPAGN